MSSQRKFLEESIDSYRESARHDKNQFLASFVIAATGIALAGVGIGSMINGNIAGGAAELGIGSTMAVVFGQLGLKDVRSFTDMTAQIAVRQYQIEQLAE